MPGSTGWLALVLRRSSRPVRPLGNVPRGRDGRDVRSRNRRSPAAAWPGSSAPPACWRGRFALAGASHYLLLDALDRRGIRIVSKPPQVRRGSRPARRLCPREHWLRAIALVVTRPRHRETRVRRPRRGVTARAFAGAAAGRLPAGGVDEAGAALRSPRSCSLVARASASGRGWCTIRRASPTTYGSRSRRCLRADGLRSRWCCPCRTCRRWNSAAGAAKRRRSPPARPPCCDPRGGRRSPADAGLATPLACRPAPTGMTIEDRDAENASASAQSGRCLLVGARCRDGANPGAALTTLAR